MRVDDVRDLLDDVFEEEAFAIGGLVAAHPVSDIIVERLVRSLTVIRARTLRKLEGRDAGQPEVERGAVGPHPAIETFLAQLGRV
jgi:hypothetical protein